MNVEWHFLQLTMVKVDGTVKWLVAKLRLQKANKDYISIALEIFNWCKGNTNGTIFFYIISISALKRYSQCLKFEGRYSEYLTVPGSRSHHCFIPFWTSQMEMWHWSCDSLFCEPWYGWWHCSSYEFNALSLSNLCV